MAIEVQRVENVGMYSKDERDGIEELLKQSIDRVKNGWSMISMERISKKTGDYRNEPSETFFGWIIVWEKPV